jgi:bifunctional non-homologous end joining protein LigD
MPAELLARVTPPMLATLAPAPPADGAHWHIELKYDGFRALAAVTRGALALHSRNGLDLAGRFPTLARALAHLDVGEAVLDGEVCALDATGRPRFQLLGAGAARQVYVAFDLLWLDGTDLRARPLEERRAQLERVLERAPVELTLAERLEGPPARALAEAAARGLEGVVLKLAGSPYEPGRARAWLKLKALAEQDVAVVGWLPHKNGPDQVGALLVAVSDGERLRFAGKVGTGFSTAQRRELVLRLRDDRVPTPLVVGAGAQRDATWVAPRLVAQVRYAEWTADGKLRHPSFRGLRDDKAPLDTRREQVEPPPPMLEAPAPSASATAPPEPARATAPPEPPRATAPPEPAPAAAAPDSPAPVVLTSPGKAMYPDDGLTKADVAAYYAAVAPALLAALADRPLALERWPHGVGQPSWYQQNIGREARPWMDLIATPARARVVHHLIASGRDALDWLAQMAVLTLHMWSSRRGSLDSPDWVVFDFDPADGRGVEQAIAPALALRALTERLGVPTVVKTSGKRGLHVLVPLARGAHRHDQAAAWAWTIGERLAAELPDVTLERAKADRHGRLYLDCVQNGMGRTLVAPYSLRGLAGAPVSTPLRWDEVTPALDPKRWNLRTLPARIAELGDLFAPALAAGVRLPPLAM